MAAQFDVVELVHEQLYLGQTVNNVYFFQAAVAGATLVSLATWFETNVVPKVKAFQVAELSHVNLRLRNLFDLGETYEEPLTGTGANAASGNELPGFFAYSIRFDHPTGDIRPGFKRYSGVSETQITDALIDAPTVTQIGGLAAELINPPTTANPNWVSVVVKRICETPNPTPGAVPACLKYRLPETALEAELGFPDSYEVSPQPTTQNSRKYYT